jgi:hypothetical protein
MWENLRYTQTRHNIATLIAWILIGIFVTCMFLFFSWLEHYTVESQNKYPPTLNCDPIVSQFMKNATAAPFFGQFASTDMPFTKEATGTGEYQCYCEEVKNNATFAAA